MFQSIVLRADIMETKKQVLSRPLLLPIATSFVAIEKIANEGRSAVMRASPVNGLVPDSAAQ
ncbi:unnamed protein product, partial [Nesidiocoris tenuis]